MRTLAAVALTILSFGYARADDYVNGYNRSNGTYVEPYHRTEPNSTKLDNYSTRGNVNPYTGQAGHVDPYSSSGSLGTGSSNYYGSHDIYGQRYR